MAEKEPIPPGGFVIRSPWDVRYLVDGEIDQFNLADALQALGYTDWPDTE